MPDIRYFNKEYFTPIDIFRIKTKKKKESLVVRDISSLVNLSLHRSMNQWVDQILDRWMSIESFGLIDYNIPIVQDRQKVDWISIDHYKSTIRKRLNVDWDNDGYPM